MTALRRAGAEVVRTVELGGVCAVLLLVGVALVHGAVALLKLTL